MEICKLTRIKIKLTDCSLRFIIGLYLTLYMCRQPLKKAYRGIEASRQSLNKDSFQLLTVLLSNTPQFTASLFIIYEATFLLLYILSCCAW
jgi:hypothetical protein